MFNGIYQRQWIIGKELLQSGDWHPSLKNIELIINIPIMHSAHIWLRKQVSDNFVLTDLTMVVDYCGTAIRKGDFFGWFFFFFFESVNSNHLSDSLYNYCYLTSLFWFSKIVFVRIESIEKSDCVCKNVRGKLFFFFNFSSLQTRPSTSGRGGSIVLFLGWQRRW